jgi:hypothetical protein
MSRRRRSRSPRRYEPRSATTHVSDYLSSTTPTERPARPSASIECVPAVADPNKDMLRRMTELVSVRTLSSTEYSYAETALLGFRADSVPASSRPLATVMAMATCPGGLILAVAAAARASPPPVGADNSSGTLSRRSRDGTVALSERAAFASRETSDGRFVQRDFGRSVRSHTRSASRGACFVSRLRPTQQRRPNATQPRRRCAQTCSCSRTSNVAPSRAGTKVKLSWHCCVESDRAAPDDSRSRFWFRSCGRVR